MMQQFWALVSLNFEQTVFLVFLANGCELEPPTAAADSSLQGQSRFVWDMKTDRYWEEKEHRGELQDVTRS